MSGAPPHETSASVFPEGQRWEEAAYPSSHASVHDNPLAGQSLASLRALLDANGVDYHDCHDKDELVQRCVDHGLGGGSGTNQPAASTPAAKAGTPQKEQNSCCGCSGGAPQATTANVFPEGQPWGDNPYPATHSAQHDNPLNAKRPGELRALLQAAGVSFSDCVDKDDLIQRCLDNGIQG
eukprot:CAMPEP_0177663316 /NCGR_PEP_ID=MMETSP0447-20121125/19844_1 /TAXON_ID=0 /ORGANISM="Stygamoeba regulata, Strain BSH-02190019" /LENGTH=180 /DNA_ID=CAMNT_0019169111 /DNA_START=98 /DNA_END=640 /DNA_ORIENTATION=+